MWSRALLAGLFALLSISPLWAQQPNSNVWQPAGPQFSTVLSLARHPSAPNELLAGAYFGGLYKSVDYGFSWTHVETTFSSRSIFSITYTSATTVYVATFQGGVYRSVDGGMSWSEVNNGLTDLDVQVIAHSPFDSNLLLAATSNGGVFRSTDGGAHWTRTDAGTPPLRGKTIAFHPAQPGVVYLGTIGQGAFRSVDGGQTFEPFSEGIAAASVLSMRFGAAPSHVLYASTDFGAYKLAADATTWTDITGNLPPYPISDLLPHPVLEHMAFAATLVGVFVVSDHTVSTDWVGWTNVPTRVLAADPSGTVFHAGSIHGGLQATVNFGQTWYQANWGIQNLFVGALGIVDGGSFGSVVFAGSDFAVHRGALNTWETFFDQKQGVFDIQPAPGNPGTLYIGTERSGVWKTVDWGTTWQPSSTNLVPAQIYSLGQSADGKTLFAGTSSGLYLSPDNGNLWLLGNATELGIVLAVAPDPTRHPFVFVGGADGRVLRSEDGGWSYTNASNGLPTENIVSLVTAPWEKTYAITQSGALFATSDNGLNWFAAKAGVTDPAVAIAADAQRPWILYLGTSGGGVFKSESGSLDWLPRNTGLTSPFVFSLAVDPTDTNTVYAGTLDGVFKSSDGAGSWTRHAEGLPAGAVTAVLVDATNAQVVYASIQDSGIFRSSDGGSTWSAVTGSVPSSGAMPLLINKLAPAQLFTGTSLNGVYRSDDSGASWNQSSFGMTLFVRGLAVNPTTPTTLYAGSLGAGVFKSTDGAETWTNVGLQDRNIFKLAIDPRQPETVYAATSRGLSRSTDGGTTWRGLGQKAAFVHAMVVDPRNRDRVFIGTTAGGVYRSTDGGETWEFAGGGLPPYTVFALAIDAASGALYAGPERQGVWRSTNDGATWTLLPGGLLDSAHVTSLHVGPDQRVFAGSLGSGVFIYSGGAWSLSSAGLASPQIADVEVLANGVVMAATFDAGVFRSTDGGSNWMWASSGLTTNRVTSLTADPGQAGGVFAATPDGVFRSDDGGDTWHARNTGLRRINTWGVAIDPAASTTLFAGTNGHGVYRSTDGGASWLPAISGLANVDARVVAVGSSSNTLFAGTLGGGVARSHDAGGTWTGGITLDLVDSFVLALAVNPVNPNIVYAGTAGRGVLKSTNGGIDWQPVTNGLGSLFLLSLAIDRDHPETLYAGTIDSGVFYTTNGGTSWHPLNDGLFNPVVTSLAVAPGDSSLIYAGTEGGGVFTNRVSLAPPGCSFTPSVTALNLTSSATDFEVLLTTAAGCSWRVESGAEWLAVDGSLSRTGPGAVRVTASINISQDARSGVVVVAGTRIVVVQAGLQKLMRLTLALAGTGAGSVVSDWTGIACGTDCEQLFTDSLPVVLTATAQPGSTFAGWEGDADCVDGSVVMAADRQCVARFEASDDFDEDGLPNLWEAKFGLDAGNADDANGADGDPDGDGLTNSEELADGTHPRGTVTRYFASGHRSANHQTRLDLFNAGAEDAHLLVHIIPDSGERSSEYRLLSALGRTSIDMSSLPETTGGFAVIVESDLDVVGERTLTQISPHATDAASLASTSLNWFVAAANGDAGRRLEYTVFNPGSDSALVDLIYLPDGAAPVARQHTIAAGDRLIVDAHTDAGAGAVRLAGAIVSNVPVVAEAIVRSATGDATLGTFATAAAGYMNFLAAGQTNPLVSSSIDVFNVTGEATTITVTYVLAGGGIVQRQHTVAGFASLSIDPVGDDALLEDATFGVVASAASPFVMTSSTWWPGTSADWYGGAGTVSATTAARRWAIGYGEIGGADNSLTEIAIANVSARAGAARLRLCFDDGTSIERSVDVPPVARVTVDVAQLFPEAAFKRFSALIDSQAAGDAAAPDLVIEHSTFTSPGGMPRAGGTRVLATPIFE
jgi:photosystem II stability/assembly factor-like uncharacterized protein